MQDRPLVGEGDEVPLVVRCALAEVRQVAGDMNAADKLVWVGQVIDVLDAAPRHAVHVQRDGAVVGELDADGVGLKRRAGRSHQIRDDVHGLADGGTAHVPLEQRTHLARRMPVVVDALVRRAGRGHDGPLLGARGVLDIAAGVVASLARWLDLAGG